MTLSIGAVAVMCRGGRRVLDQLTEEWALLLAILADGADDGLEFTRAQDRAVIPRPRPRHRHHGQHRCNRN